MKSQKPAKKAKVVELKIPVRCNDAIFREEKDGSVYILRLDFKKNYYHLEKLAADLWHTINGKRDTDKIVQTLAKQYKVTEKCMTIHVNRFLKELEKERLVTF